MGGGNLHKGVINSVMGSADIMTAIISCLFIDYLFTRQCTNCVCVSVIPYNTGSITAPDMYSIQ